MKGSIYAIGGCSNGLQASTANEVYDPAIDTWTTKTPMKQKRLGHFVGLIRDKIYVIGGHYPNLNIVSRTEEYDTGFVVLIADFNSDGVIDLDDLVIMIESWGTDDILCDIAPPPDGDGIVDILDLELFINYWKQENMSEEPQDEENGSEIPEDNE